MTFEIRSSRVADQFILIDNDSTALDGDQNIDMALPAGFGDCLLLDAHILVAGIATMKANPELAGVACALLVPGGPQQDYLGVGRWHRVSATQVRTQIDPDQLRYWSANESMRVTFEEIDTNAVPTAALEVHVRVRRLRQDRTMRPTPGPYSAWNAMDPI